MMCPSCHSAYSQVSKTMKVGKTMVRRYRICMHCSNTFHTSEQIVDPKRKKKPEKTGEIDTLDDYYMIDDDDLDL